MQPQILGPHLAAAALRAPMGPILLRMRGAPCSRGGPITSCLCAAGGTLSQQQQHQQLLLLLQQQRRSLSSFTSRFARQPRVPAATAAATAAATPTGAAAAAPAASRFAPRPSRVRQKQEQQQQQQQQQQRQQQGLPLSRDTPLSLSEVQHSLIRIVTLQVLATLSSASCCLHPLLLLLLLLLMSCPLDFRPCISPRRLDASQSKSCRGSSLPRPLSHLSVPSAAGAALATDAYAAAFAAAAALAAAYAAAALAADAYGAAVALAADAYAAALAAAAAACAVAWMACFRGCWAPQDSSPFLLENVFASAGSDDPSEPDEEEDEEEETAAAAAAAGLDSHAAEAPTGEAAAAAADNLIRAHIHNSFDPEKRKTFNYGGRVWLCKAEGRGTRKRAAALAVLTRGTGQVRVCGREEVFTRWAYVYNRMEVLQPLHIAGAAGLFDVDLEVRGGGPSGQAAAARLAIGRALVAACKDCQPQLEEEAGEVQQQHLLLLLLEGASTRHDGFIRRHEAAYAEDARKDEGPQAETVVQALRQRLAVFGGSSSTAKYSAAAAAAAAIAATIAAVKA
ncbi:hypothetical protein Emag_003113 [Eimeria magna]